MVLLAAHPSKITDAWRKIISMNVFERIDVGIRAWFGAWFIEGAAETIAPAVRSRGALPAPVPDGERGRGGEGETRVPKPTRPVAPVRSEALTLLEVLQREARLIDFLREDLSGYDDAQIGAAVRDVHRDSAKVLERLFALQPVIAQEEGTTIDVANEPPGRTRLVGNVREGATQGTLVHAGWQATRVALPKWSGGKEAERVVAPAEVEVS